MRTLHWSPAAERDLFDIADRYGAIAPDLAITVLDRVKTAPLSLLDYPAIGSPTRWPGIRKWHANRTPFLLFYAVEEEAVVIRRVVDAASDWQNRP